MKSVVVFGAKGMLGTAVSAYFGRKGYAVTQLSRGEHDIATAPPEKLKQVLAKADAAINCAGVIKPQIATMPIEHVLRVNAIFPRNLARVSNELKVPCVHITTDCVYSGRVGGYDERALFDAEDVYGMSKNAGDGAECMVLRTSIIGEEKGQGRSLLAWAQSQAGKEVNGFTNHRWNGVTTVHLAEAIEQLLAKGEYQQGVFHVHSPDAVNKAELLQILSAAYDLRLTVKPVEAKDFCDRTLQSVHPLTQALFQKPLRRQVEEMRKFFSA